MRRRLLFAVLLPLAAWVLARVADRIEARIGRSKGTAVLRAPDQWRQSRR
jgi:hypothetical protein